MPLFNVFITDADTGILLPITVVNGQQAVAKALVFHPAAIATAVPAEALEGSRPNVLLAEWMRMVGGDLGRVLGSPFLAKH